MVTATETETGGDSIGMFFAGIVGFDSAEIGAEAIVAWGASDMAFTLPLIFSECEWERDLPGWPSGSPDGLPWAGEELTAYPMATIYFHDPLDDEAVDDTCTVHPGLDLPGGFGYIDTSGACTTEIEDGGLTGVYPGNAPPSSCSASYFADLLASGEPVRIPYYDGIPLTPNGDYNVSGHGLFVIGGYRLVGPYQGGDAQCGPPTSCLSGWFVRDVDPGGTPGGLGGDDRGDIVLELIG